MFRRVKYHLGRQVARWLARERRHYVRIEGLHLRQYDHLLRPGDLILVEGNTRFSAIVKALTQSTWSHIVMVVGPYAPIDPEDDSGDPNILMEVDVQKGVIAVPLSKYAHANTRICRPMGLSSDDVERLCRFMTDRQGMTYDLRNIWGMLGYFFPWPGWLGRRRRAAQRLDSGDADKRICSSLIAEAFQSIRYPILPRYAEDERDGRPFVPEEVILQKRHHSLFAPRDFDLSPYFAVVKPTLEGFNFRHLQWREEAEGAEDAGDVPKPPDEEEENAAAPEVAEEEFCYVDCVEW